LSPARRGSIRSRSRPTSSSTTTSSSSRWRSSTWQDASPGGILLSNNACRLACRPGAPCRLHSSRLLGSSRRSRSHRVVNYVGIEKYAPTRHLAVSKVLRFC
jgi:hypothetical protein